MRLNLAIILILFFHILCYGQSITLDESFDDWLNGTSRFLDKNGDANAAGIDFTQVRSSNDEGFLFLYFELNKEVNIQENNNLAIYIDVDNNPSTGLNKFGIGSDLVYNLGSRNGKYYSGQFSTTVFQNDIGLITSPTVTSSKFELCILRKFIANGTLRSMADTIKFVLSDESINGDKAPDAGGNNFSFDNNRFFIPHSFSINKKDDRHLRIMSYNVLRDKLFAPEVQSNFERVFKATLPDIIGFCEIYNNSSAQTASLIEKHMPSKAGSKWYHSGVNPDIRVISRYPIVNTRSLDGNGAFLIDLGYSKLVFIVAHLPCCENEVQRQQEIDNIMAFVRGIRYGVSPFQVPQNTPIIIVGDMNLVGLRHQQQTFITGNIAENNVYGPDFTPDWDESSMDDGIPATTNTPATFTWYDAGGTYSAGRLDYIFYTGSMMKQENGYVLWTPALTQSQLNTYNLQKNDVPACSDHLPVICDFSMSGQISPIEEVSEKWPFNWEQNGTEWNFSASSTGLLSIADISGKVLLSKVIDSESEPVRIDTQGWHSPAIYIVQFQTKGRKYVQKICR
jgi:exonuclease III